MVLSYLMQWAAVRTQLLATREPPQVCCHFPEEKICRETWGREEQVLGWEKLVLSSLVV